MALNCPKYQNDRRRRNFDRTELSDIRIKVREYNRILRAAQANPRARTRRAIFQAEQVAVRNEWERLTANVVTLDPRQGNRIEDFLVSMFGILNRGGVEQGRYSDAGAVRYNLLQAQQIAEGIINSAGRIESVRDIRKFINAFDEITRQYNIPRNIREELIDDTLTVGQIPRNTSNTVYYRHAVLGRQSPVDRFQRMRYNQYMRKMADAGIPLNDINRLINMATDVTTAFDRVRVAATAIGVDIGSLEDLGYLTRRISQDFSIRLRNDIAPQDLLDQINNGVLQLSTIFNRSRSTYHFLPEDVTFVSKILGIEPNDIMNMLDDSLVWRNYLHENLTVEQIDSLVDAGVLQKLPMSSREVFDYFVKQYDLPYQRLSDMFDLDIDRVLSEYTTSLMRSAGHSAMIRQIVNGRAFREGWAISDTVFRENRTEFANFVQIGEGLDRWAVQNKLTPQQIAANLGVQPHLVDRLSKIYVHPIVAAQWKAMFEISVTPSLMNGAARTIYQIGRWFTRRALTTTQFVFNSTLGNIISATAAGANMAYHIPSIMDLGRLLHDGYEAFDNVRPFRTVNGQTYTKREVFRTFMEGRGQSVVPGGVQMLLSRQGINIPAAFQHLFSIPGEFQKALSELIQYTMAHGDPVNGRRIPMYERFNRFTERSWGMVDELLDESFAPFALMNNFFDIAFKWSTFQSVLHSDDFADNVGQVLSSLQYKRFNTFDEAFRHIDEYFVNPYNVGRTTAFLNNYVMPFRVWAMANPPMQLRHMLRNPHVYLAYHRIMSFQNQDLRDDDNATEAGFPAWVLDEYPMYIGRDSDGNPIVSMPGTYDPIMSGFVYYNELSEDISRFAGYRVGSQAEQRADIRGESFGDFLLDLANQSHLPWKILLEQVMGRDTFRGTNLNVSEASQYPTYLGMRMHPRLRAVVEKIPLLSHLNRANPGGIFGERPMYDVNGNLISPGRLSIFNQARSDNDTSRYDLEDEHYAFTLLRAAGLPIRVIDYERNNQTTLTDIEKTLNFLQDSIDNNISDLQRRQINGEAMSQDEYNRRVSEVREQVLLFGQLQIDQARVLNWMQRNEVLPRNAIREIDRQRILIRNLPYPAEQELNQIIEENLNYYQQIRRLGEE